MTYLLDSADILLIFVINEFSLNFVSVISSTLEVLSCKSLPDLTSCFAAYQSRLERGRDCACYLLRECVSRSRELGMIFLQTGEVIKSSASAVSCVGACVPFAKNMCGSLVLSLSLSLSSFSFTQIYLAYDDTVRRRRRRECCRTTLHSFSRLKLFIEISKNGLSDVLRLL